MMAQGTGRQEDQRQNKRGRRSLLVFFSILAAIVLAAIAGGLAPRIVRQRKLLAASAEMLNRKPAVMVTPAHFAASRDSVELPGDLQAIVESPIFARADGYMKARLVDIGDHVKTGQVLAEIETPELDQQITQAGATLSQSQSTLKELQADLELSRANLNLARVTLDRWQRLADQGVVSRQDRDEKNADFAVKQAQTQKAEASLATAQDAVRANEASLRRFEEMKGFARVTAPFDGVVTARNVDVGTLINSGNGGPAKEMFRVARIQPLRVFVNVPQSYVGSVRVGQSAELRVQERPRQIFPARVTRIADSLDTTSRSMLAILETPNAGAVLYPGMYAQVRFLSAQAKPILRISGDALLLGKSGPRVAVVGADHVAHFRNIAIGEDLGTEVEVISGLAPGEQVISSPSDAVQENTVVDPHAR
ncbi:MAG TPA: efflux RND transporter periplasmic adaptor subunit [Bryobacteraceae bacterium]|nr:efflux RND transporter periplasmic adaptor subunit [Bryobacteraceae bacterium]